MKNLQKVMAAGFLLLVAVSSGCTGRDGAPGGPGATGPGGPLITGVSPGEARSGDEILVTGSAFGASRGASTISIGGQNATGITNWSDHEIRVIVPAGATSGSVIVTVGKTTSSPGFIVVLWNTDSIVGISKATGDQEQARLVSDGSGGAIMAWQDLRNGNYDIYAQRVNSLGAAQWTANGIVISAAAGNQLNPRLVPDGSGGALIVWEDFRDGNGDIYAQRVDSSGAAQWTAGGIPIAQAASYDETSPQLATDGSGGAIVAWQDLRNGNYDIYAQRMNSSGQAQWTAGGIVVSTATGSQQHPQLVPNGSGGAIIAWEDYRSVTNGDIYSQQVSSAGAAQWAADGVAVAASADEENSPQLAPDGAGGAIIAWQARQDEFRVGLSWNIYAQRLDALGALSWDGQIVNAGVANQDGDQTAPQIVADGDGGAIILWQDSRGGYWDLYAQRVNFSGTTLWQYQGLLVRNTGAPAAAALIDTTLVSDGQGGAIVAWSYPYGMSDVYAQRVNAYGLVEWPASGVSVGNAFGYRRYPRAVEDGTGGAIMVWQEYDVTGSDLNLYAQGISHEGSR